MKKKNYIRSLFPREFLDSNTTAMESYSYYRKVSDIIYKTNTALGKNKFVNASNSSTEEISIDSNAFKSTT